MAQTPNTQIAAVEKTGADTVIELSAVRHVYRKTTALEGIDLALPAGCVSGLIGPDGVGKSTLLGLVAGIRRIQSGQVQVLGTDLRDPAQRAAVCYTSLSPPARRGQSNLLRMHRPPARSRSAQLASVSFRQRHRCRCTANEAPNIAGTDGVQGRSYRDDLHPCPKPRRTRCPSPANGLTRRPGER